MKKKIIVLTAIIVLVAVAVAVSAAVSFSMNKAVEGTIEERLSAAEQLSEEGKIKKAENTYKSVLKETPTDVVALEKLVDLYIGQKKFSDAVSVVKMAINTEPENLTFYDMFIGVFRESGEIQNFFDHMDSITDPEIYSYCYEVATDRKNENSLVIGNYPANHANGGLIAFYKDLIIYADPASGGDLYINENGAKRLLAEGQYTSINVVGDYVYCVDSYAGNSIARISIADGAKEAVLDVPASNLMVIGNKMYFINWNDESKLYCTNLDGEKLKKLSDHPTDAVYYSRKRLYMNSRNEAGSIISITLDGENEKKEFMHQAHSLSGYEDELYFRESETSSIWRTDEAEEVYEAIFEGRAAYVTATKDYVFFIDLDNEAIMRMNTDGTEKKVLANDNATALSIDSDRLYYFAANDGRKLYSIKFDGNDRICLG